MVREKDVSKKAYYGEKFYGIFKSIGKYERKASEAAAPLVKRGFLESAKYTAMGLEYLEKRKLDELKEREAKGTALTESEKKEMDRLERKIKKTQATEERIKGRIEVFKKAEEERKAASKAKLAEVTGERYAVPAIIYKEEAK
jgi:hypothetical protein